MIKEGDVIQVKPSEPLSLMRLDMLAGREAVVTQDLTSIARLNRGYMVELDKPYLGETEWFIPWESIEEEEEDEQAG